MSRKLYTALDVIQQATAKCEQKDAESVLLFMAEEYLRQLNSVLNAIEETDQVRGSHKTIVACLVKQMGGKARIPRADMEDPPFLHEDDDPISGDWIYATTSLQRQAGEKNS